MDITMRMTVLLLVILFFGITPASELPKNQDINLSMINKILILPANEKKLIIAKYYFPDTPYAKNIEVLSNAVFNRSNGIIYPKIEQVVKNTRTVNIFYVFLMIEIYLVILIIKIQSSGTDFFNHETAFKYFFALPLILMIITISIASDRKNNSFFLNELSRCDTSNDLISYEVTNTASTDSVVYNNKILEGIFETGKDLIIFHRGFVESPELGEIKPFFVDLLINDCTVVDVHAPRNLIYDFLNVNLNNVEMQQHVTYTKGFVDTFSIFYIPKEKIPSTFMSFNEYTGNRTKYQGYLFKQNETSDILDIFILWHICLGFISIFLAYLFFKRLLFMILIGISTLGSIFGIYALITYNFKIMDENKKRHVVIFFKIILFINLAISVIALVFH